MIGRENLRLIDLSEYGTSICQVDSQNPFVSSAHPLQPLEIFLLTFEIPSDTIPWIPKVAPVVAHISWSNGSA